MRSLQVSLLSRNPSLPPRPGFYRNAVVRAVATTVLPGPARAGRRKRRGLPMCSRCGRRRVGSLRVSCPRRGGTRRGTTWSQQACLKTNNTGAGDWFGWSVGVSGDTVVVGAPYEGSTATGINGNEADNSAAYAGAAWIFTGRPWNGILRGSFRHGRISGLFGTWSYPENGRNRKWSRWHCQFPPTVLPEKMMP